MQVEAEDGVPESVAQAVVKSAVSVLKDRKATVDLYRAIVAKNGDQFIVSFIDKKYVYMRGHRGNPGQVQAIDVVVSGSGFKVVSYRLSR